MSRVSLNLREGEGKRGVEMSAIEKIKRYLSLRRVVGMEIGRTM